MGSIFLGETKVRDGIWLFTAALCENSWCYYFPFVVWFYYIPSCCTYKRGDTFHAGTAWSQTGLSYALNYTIGRLLKCGIFDGSSLYMQPLTVETR